MKIAIVLERIEGWRGGAETSTRQFTNALTEAGHDVHFISRTPRTPLEGITVHAVDNYSAMKQQRTLTFARHAAHYTERMRFDIIHAITPCITADIYQPRGGFVVESVRRNLALHASPFAKALKRLGNQFNKKQQGMIRLERKLLTRRPRPPFIAAVSEYVARQAHEHFRFPNDRVRVIFNGVELDHTPPAERQAHRKAVREQYQIQPDELLALFIAHNFKLKGLKPLLLAVERLVGRNLPIRLLIVGHGNTLPYQRLARSMGIADRIQFAGATAVARPFLYAADMLAHPTYYDPCSRVVLEAIASGLPAVTTRHNGAAEILTDNVTGQIVDDPDDIPALTEAMARLADPAHRAAVATGALDLCDRFDIRNHTKKMIRLYEEVRETKPSRTAP